MAANLVAEVGEAEKQWLALPTTRDPEPEAVDLRGAHDFRHTFATWLEDAGIPARVIDEVMGLRPPAGSASSRLVLEVAEQALEAHPKRSALALRQPP